MGTVASGARTAANQTGPGLMPLGHPLPRSITLDLHWSLACLAQLFLHILPSPLSLEFLP